MSTATWPELDRQQFQLLQRLLVEESGLYFDSDRQGLLRAGLAARMTARRLGSVHEYYQLLKGQPDGRQEIKSLIDLVTVGETYFFRLPAQFDAIRHHLLPPLVQARQSGPRTVRVWSAACSTGEEPYSLAISLLEALPEPDTWDISILATDVNREHLRRAAAAEYGLRAVRLVPPEWREKYFRQRGDQFLLRDTVKRRVKFLHHNLVRDLYTAPEMERLDLLFCRNVTIYFQLDTTRAIMERFADCLASTGHLFIGDAEMLWQITDKFVPVVFQNAFLYRLATARDRAHPQPVPLALDIPLPTAPAPVAPPVTRTLPVPDPVDAAASLQQATLLANEGRHDDAIALLRDLITHDNLCGPAYYLLGTLYSIKNETNHALAAFRRAVYVEPHYGLAYIALANIHRKLGRPADARREFQNALTPLRGLADDQLVLHSEDLTAGYLRAICQRNLEQLAAAQR